jgi:hypothetical protein
LSAKIVGRPQLQPPGELPVFDLLLFPLCSPDFTCKKTM